MEPSSRMGKQFGGGGGAIYTPPAPGGSVLETEDGRVLETEDGKAIKLEQ